MLLNVVIQPVVNLNPYASGYKLSRQYNAQNRFQKRTEQVGVGITLWSFIKRWLVWIQVITLRRHVIFLSVTRMCQEVPTLNHDRLLPNRFHLTIHQPPQNWRNIGGAAKQDDLLEPYFRRQVWQDFLIQAYGSNTDHYLGERSQRFLLATQGIAVCWEIH